MGKISIWFVIFITTRLIVAETEVPYCSKSITINQIICNFFPSSSITLVLSNDEVYNANYMKNIKGFETLISHSVANKHYNGNLYTIKILYTSEHQAYQEVDLEWPKKAFMPVKIMEKFHRYLYSKIEIYIMSPTFVSGILKHKIRYSPNLIIIYCESCSDDPYLYREVYQLKIPYHCVRTSAFLAVTTESTKLHLICVNCNDKIFETVKPENIQSVQHMESSWKKLNRNMRRTIVHTSGDHEDSTDFKNVLKCDLRHYNNHIDYHYHCFLVTIQNKLNFTLSYRNKDKSKTPIKAGSTVTHSVGIYSTKRFIINEMILVQRQSFFTVTEETFTDANILEKLFEPFDIATWVTLAVASVSFVLLFHFKSMIAVDTRNPTSKFNHFLLIYHTFVILLGSFLDQGVGAVETFLKSFRTKSLMLMVTWILWGYMTLTIGNAYKGVLTSLITKQNPPSVPEDLDELSNSNANPIITTDTVQTQNIKGISLTPLFSVLNSSILDALANMNNSRRKQIFKKLQVGML